MVAVRLGNVRMIPCASPAYLERAGTPSTPGELSGHACLAYAPPGSAGRVRWRFEGAHGEQTRLEPALRADSSLLLRDLACAGAGIALLPSFVADPCIQCGSLLELLTGVTAKGRTIYAMYPSPRYTAGKVRLFVRFLKSVLAPTSALAAAEPRVRPRGSG